MLRRALKLATTPLHLRPFFPSSSSLFNPSRFTSSLPLTPPTSSLDVSADENTTNDPHTPPQAATISVDRSGLYNPKEHSHEGPEKDSELVRHLKSIIKFRGGPISVAEYMEEVLTNPKAGFYINRDVFGAEGDFITSPEVSQMFGEMIGVWAMCLWEQMGQPTKVNLVELGPGRGTLMADLLRGTSKFNKFKESLHIRLVECSPTLQRIQRKNLKCVDGDSNTENADTETISSIAGTPVSWHPVLDEVPSGVPTIIIAHEFFDALPVHQFQITSRGWCEKMVDVTEDSSFCFVLSPSPTPANLFLMRRFKWAAEEEVAKLDQIEVCPSAMELIESIAKRIGSDGGGALVIDYGVKGLASDTLQAIRKHKFVHILDDPGSADLSAYVDFASIRHSAEDASDQVAVHGPITQSQFLCSLGLNFRIEALLQDCTDEQAESLQVGYWQLVGEGEAPFWEGPDNKVPIGMGTRYMVMALVNKKQGAPVPFNS
ncbi:arginine methyltransferase NDUFAF7 homolog, mitochondrial-like protein [Drosera capensis]